MNTRTKQILELSAVLIVLFLIVILFAALVPVVFSSDASMGLRILFELSPFIAMVAAVVLATVINKRPLAEALGLSAKHMPKQLLTALIIFLITISMVVLPLLAGADKANVLSFKPRNIGILVYYIIKNMIFVGLGEEIIWRGYFYERLKEVTGSGIWSVVLSSVLFGIWHYPIGGNIMQVVMVSGLGLIYGFTRLKVKHCSVLATGLAHGLHNTAILVLSYFLL